MMARSLSLSLSALRREPRTCQDGMSCARVLYVMFMVAIGLKCFTVAPVGWGAAACFRFWTREKFVYMPEYGASVEFDFNRNDNKDVRP